MNGETSATAKTVAPTVAPARSGEASKSCITSGRMDCMA